ncbi:MAG: hypothetical protein AAF702_45685 [Chloroflexota bacterium]
MEVRQSKRQIRHGELATWLEENYSGMKFEDVPRTDIMDKFGVGRDTALSDLKAVWESRSWNGEVPT